jgi:hypothetical protein
MVSEHPGADAGDDAVTRAVHRLGDGEVTALRALAEAPGPLDEKRRFSSRASVAAAHLIARAGRVSPAVRREFCVIGGAVVASPMAGEGAEPWLLLAAPDGSLARTPGLVALGAAAAAPAAALRLAERHGWTLPPDRIERFRRAEALRGFFGLGRLEFLAAFAAHEARGIAGSASDFAGVVYPLWKPRALGLTLTYRCNASCEHCYNVSGPNRSPLCLGWSETSEHLEDWALAGVTDVGLSGGEPFLYPDQVVELVRHLKRLGVPLVSPFTNGFWGVDPGGAERILRELRAAGFGDSPKDQIKISTGDFHRPFVAFDHLLRLAAQHYAILGTRAILDVALAADDSVLRELIRAAKALGIEKQIQWTARSTVSNSGRARAFYDALPSEDRSLAAMRCPIKASGTLYTSGDWVYCSGTSYPTDYRRIGNLETDGTFTVLARAQLDPRVPYWQFGTFADYLVDYPRPGFEAGAVQVPSRGTVCGTCREIFGPSRPRHARQLPVMTTE